MSFLCADKKYLDAGLRKLNVIDPAGNVREGAPRIFIEEVQQPHMATIGMYTGISKTGAVRIEGAPVDFEFPVTIDVL